MVVSPVVAEGKEAGLFITAAAVVDDPTDHAQLGPMLEQAEETTGVRAETTLADGGYHPAATGGMRPKRPTGGHAGTLESSYHKDRFVYDEANDRYRCPEGRWLNFTRINRNRDHDAAGGSGPCAGACPAFGSVRGTSVMGAA